VAIVPGPARECWVARRPGPFTAAPRKLTHEYVAAPVRVDAALGPVEVIAIGPPDSPLPVTGHCFRCGEPTTVYGPRGRPICDQCRASRTAGTTKDAEPA
jgi:hypothetical protein